MLLLIDRVMQQSNTYDHRLYRTEEFDFSAVQDFIY